MDMKMVIPAHYGSISALKRQVAFVRVVLRPGDLIISTLGEHLNSLQRNQDLWRLHTLPSGQAKLKGIHHLFYLTVEVSNFLRKRNRGCPMETVFGPEDLIDKIQVGEKWTRHIPSTFHAKYKLRLFQTVTTPTNGDDNADSAADLSPPTGGTGGTGAAKEPGGMGNKDGKISERKENRRFNETLFGKYKKSSKKCKDLRDQVAAGTLDPLPKSIHVPGMNMCLAWYTKGQCNVACPCADDHFHYTAQQYQPMCEWCDKNYGV